MDAMNLAAICPNKATGKQPIFSDFFLRFLEVVYPIWHKTHFSMRMCYISLGLPWFIGIVWNTAYMLPTAKIEDGQCGVYAYWPSPTFRSVFGVIIVLIQFFIPIMTLVFCYGRIALVLSSRIKVFSMILFPNTL